MFYTYLIGWPTLDKWYYGVRNSKTVDASEDLWVKYKTSSKTVAEFVLEHGDPDVVEVRRVFSSWSSAIQWEHRVLSRLRVVFAEKWLNKTDNRCMDRRGLKHSIETRQKMSESRKGKQPNLGNQHSDVSKQKMSESRKLYLANNPGAIAKMAHGKGGPDKATILRINSDPNKIAKTALKNKGKKRSPEQIERIRQGALNRRKVTNFGD